MKYVTFLVVIILSILTLSHCKKSTEPIGGEKPLPGYQEDIPWPSLADSPWPMSHHDPQNTGRSKLLGPSLGVISWEFDEAYKMFNSVVVSADSIAYILIPPADGGLFAFNPDGTIKSSFNLETVTGSKTFAIDKEGYFYYIDEHSTLYVIDQQGNIQWTLQDDRFYTNPAYISFSPDGNTIYVLSRSDMFLAVDINTKQIRWTFKNDVLPDESVTRPVDGVVVDSYGNIYLLVKINNDVGELFVLKPDGEIKWRYKFNTQAINVNGNVPTIDKLGNIYCATDSVYSFDFDGNLRWKIGLDNISDCPLICDDNGSVYVGTMGISMMGFDTDGNQLWKIDDNQNQVGGSPAIGFNEIMYFPTWSSDKFYGIK